LEDPQFLGVCLGRLGENDFVDAEGGLVEDYFLALGWGKVDGFGDEEVHKRQDEGVDESTNAEGKFETQVLDYEAGYEMSSYHVSLSGRLRWRRTNPSFTPPIANKRGGIRIVVVSVSCRDPKAYHGFPSPACPTIS
jgi:hypothetical protein